jgi:hypothetical protein
MATQAKITSTEALESFRAALVIFLTKARRSLDDSTDEIRRMRQWVQHDQRVHYEGEFRRRKKKLEQAQQELMSVKLASHKESALMARQMAVAKAQHEVVDAENKLRKLKSWSQNYDTCADPIVKRMDRLRSSLNDLPKAIAYLVNVQKILDDYTRSGLPEGGALESAATGLEAVDASVESAETNPESPEDSPAPVEPTLEPAEADPEPEPHLSP